MDFPDAVVSQHGWQLDLPLLPIFVVVLQGCGVPRGVCHHQSFDILLLIAPRS